MQMGLCKPRSQEPCPPRENQLAYEVWGRGRGRLHLPALNNDVMSDHTWVVTVLEGGLNLSLPLQQEYRGVNTVDKFPTLKSHRGAGFSRCPLASSVLTWIPPTPI